MSDKISSNVRIAKFNDLLDNKWNIFAVSKHAPILEVIFQRVCVLQNCHSGWMEIWKTMGKSVSQAEGPLKLILKMSDGSTCTIIITLVSDSYSTIVVNFVQ